MFQPNIRSRSLWKASKARLVTAKVKEEVAKAKRAATQLSGTQLPSCLHGSWGCSLEGPINSMRVAQIELV